MQELLHIKLRQYLAVHYPDMLLSLAEEGTVEVFIRGQVESISGEMDAMLAGGAPLYEVEVHCMDVLIGSLPPSKFDYICDILEEEFIESFTAFESNGILLFEVINIINETPLADDFDEEDKLLRFEIIGLIAGYLHHPQMAGHGV